jgi:hypothetical protein
MFVKHKQLETVWSASPLEDLVLMTPLVAYLDKAFIHSTVVISADKFCEEFSRVDPREACKMIKEMRSAYV